jgi:YVTN family beta-propeller protein
MTHARNKWAWIFFLALGSLAATAATPGQYKIANRFHLPGDDRWDYLAADPATGRVFVSHGMQTQVMDEKTGKLIGTIPDTKGVHGIAFVGNLGKGYISNGKDTSVTVFDLKSLATLGKVKVTGGNPDAIIYDPFSRHIFTFNGKSDNATVIDPATDKVVATIDVGGKPEEGASDGKGNIYLNIEDKSAIAVLDAKTNKVVKTWPIAPGESPSGLALDEATGRLFSVCENKIMVIADAATGKVVASVPIGEGVDGVAFDPASKRIFASNGQGDLTVVQQKDKDHYTVLETLPTQKGARTIALDPKTHHIFLSTSEFGPAPAPSADNPKARPPVKPNSFTVLDIAPST